MIIEYIWLNLELHYFQKISNLYFGPFAADVEKTRLGVFFALFIFCRIYAGGLIFTRIDQNFDQYNTYVLKGLYV
jgi:hypothetical protein